MSSYQNLNNYKGSLYGKVEYTGIEFDYEVPDNTVVASPGGVSTTQHHYTKGLYGDGASRWDIYAGEGDAYPYGVKGNLYQQGYDSATNMGDFVVPPDKMYTQNQSLPQKDNFTATNDLKKDIELIPPADSNKILPINVTPLDIQHKIVVKRSFSQLAQLFIIILVGYLATTLWSNGIEKWVYETFNDGKEPTARRYFLYALIASIILIILAIVFKLPALAIEQNITNI